MIRRIITAFFILIIFTSLAHASNEASMKVARQVVSEFGESWGYKSDKTGKSFETYSQDHFFSTKKLKGDEPSSGYGSATWLQIVYRPDLSRNLEKILRGDKQEGPSTVLDERVRLEHEGMGAGKHVTISRPWYNNEKYENDHLVHFLYGVECIDDGLFITVSIKDRLKNKAPNQEYYMSDAKKIISQTLVKLRSKGLCPPIKGGVSGGDETLVNDKELWDRVKEKCRSKNQHPELTEQEFLAYLRRMETVNSDMDWRKLIAKMHERAYPHDTNKTLPWPLDDVLLFLHGPETDGYQNVSTLCFFEPKFVNGRDGKQIDITHSYAGLRGALNRRGWRRWSMIRTNTHWGDTWQVATHFGRRVRSLFTIPAEDFAPPNQRRGDDVGIWMTNYYSKSENKDKPLSQAYSEYFNRPRDTGLLNRISSQGLNSL